MREKPRFKQNENKEEEQDTLSPKKNKTKKKQ